MILGWLRQTLFARKLDEDVRSIETDSLWTFAVPSTLLGWGATTSTDDVPTICTILPPDFGFYTQLIAIVIFQSLFNSILGACLFKAVIEPQQRTRQTNSTVAERTKTTSMTAWLFAYGIAMPCVVLEPIWVIQMLDIRNAALIMLLLATPIVNSLKITEAFFGFAPATADDPRTYAMYFSCLFGMEFDVEKGSSKRLTLAFLKRRLATLGRDFLIVPAVFAILRPYDYEFFTTPTAVDSLDHPLSEMISWQHLCNNFLVALLISACLSQSSVGVGLVYSLLYGVQTCEVVHNPMLKSKSVSDFWGRRWNMLVHRGLKNGVYKPTRKHTTSRMWAVVATFLVSGIIHEYVNYVMFMGPGMFGRDDDDDDSLPSSYRFEWKQMLFFGWNGILLLLEYTIGHWAVFQWMSKNLPPVLVTALVLCSALPLAHLFTGDWIRLGYFDAFYFAEPVITCQPRIDGQ